jgi:hypothetical protein
MSAVQSEFFPDVNLGRAVRLTYGGIQYTIEAVPPSWRIHDEWSYCSDCGEPLTAIAPCCLHRLPLMRCPCGSAAFLTPVDDRDLALLELAHPVSEEDRKLAERFHRELRRLFKEDHSERTS